MKFKEFLTPVKIDKEPIDGQWFRHQSKDWFPVLKPISYKELKVVRPDYPVDERQDHEDDYRELVTHPSHKSFLYATLVGFNKMGNPEEFPGFTYYFRLSESQLERCIFEVVAQKDWMQPEAGLSGLNKAKKIWSSNSSSFNSYHDPEISTIDPRIEVIIPFSVYPECFYPQVEDR